MSEDIKKVLEDYVHKLLDDVSIDAPTDLLGIAEKIIDTMEKNGELEQAEKQLAWVDYLQKHYKTTQVCESIPVVDVQPAKPGELYDFNLRRNIKMDLVKLKINLASTVAFDTFSSAIEERTLSNDINFMVVLPDDTYITNVIGLSFDNMENTYFAVLNLTNDEFTTQMAGKTTNNFELRPQFRSVTTKMWGKLTLVDKLILIEKTQTNTADEVKKEPENLTHTNGCCDLKIKPFKITRRDLIKEVGTQLMIQMYGDAGLITKLNKIVEHLKFGDIKDYDYTMKPDGSIARNVNVKTEYPEFSLYDGDNIIATGLTDYWRTNHGGTLKLTNAHEKSYLRKEIDLQPSQLTGKKIVFNCPEEITIELKDYVIEKPLFKFNFIDNPKDLIRRLFDDIPGGGSIFGRLKFSYDGRPYDERGMLDIVGHSLRFISSVDIHHIYTFKSSEVADMYEFEFTVMDCRLCANSLP